MRFASILAMSTLALLLIADRAIAAPPTPDERFILDMTGARVIGNFQVTKGKHPKEFQSILDVIRMSMALTINRVTRITKGNPGDWEFVTTLKTPVGTSNLTLTLPVTFSDHGNTRLIHIPTFIVPGIDDVCGDVRIVHKKFVGVWGTSNHRGTMEGRLSTGSGGHPRHGLQASFWRTSENEEAWVGYQPNDRFADVFGVVVDREVSLVVALQRSQGERAVLMQESVASLLNAASPDVPYSLTREEVTQLVQDAFASGEFQAASMVLAEHNRKKPE